MWTKGKKVSYGPQSIVIISYIRWRKNTRYKHKQDTVSIFLYLQHWTNIFCEHIRGKRRGLHRVGGPPGPHIRPVPALPCNKIHITICPSSAGLSVCLSDEWLTPRLSLKTRVIIRQLPPPSVRLWKCLSPPPGHPVLLRPPSLSREVAWGRSREI